MTTTHAERTSGLADTGKREVGAHVHIRMHPQVGGHVDLSPATLTEMMGCDPKTVGNCGTALSLDSLRIDGANVPVDSHVVLSTIEGGDVSSHSATHVCPDGSVSGVHANLRHGNVRTGLNIAIPLQPDVYEKGGTRAENMSKAISTMKNWHQHLGKAKEAIVRESAVEIKEGMDREGNTHKRVLVNEQGPIGMLVRLNPNSDHPVMKTYAADKVVRVDGKIVMDVNHHEQLATTLAETLAPATPISKHGLRIALRPMPHAVDHLETPTTAQLDMKFMRSNVLHVMQGESSQDSVIPVTTGAVTGAFGPSGGVTDEEIAKQDAQRQKAIWDAPVGNKATTFATIVTSKNVAVVADVGTPNAHAE